MTDERDNRGNVALWKPESDNPKAPAAKGTAVAHRDIKEGETVEIALWNNQSDNPKAPRMKGRMSDKREQQDSAPQSPAPDDDSSIPF